MNIKAYINAIVKASFIEIGNVLDTINHEMQNSYKGNLLIKNQHGLLHDIEQMYEMIYKPAYDMGINVMHDDYDSNNPEVYVENACNNLVRAFEYFKNPPIVKIEGTIQETKNSERKTQNNTTQKSINTDWLTLEEVCQVFHLPKNSVKDRKWRTKKQFPFHQDEPYGSITYNRKEIEEWMKNNKKC